jgi:hypothetical protein
MLLRAGRPHWSVTHFYSVGCRFKSRRHLLPPFFSQGMENLLTVPTALSSRLGGIGNKPKNSRSPATNLPRDSVTPVTAGPGEDCSVSILCTKRRNVTLRQASAH